MYEDVFEWSAAARRKGSFRKRTYVFSIECIRMADVLSLNIQQPNIIFQYRRSLYSLYALFIYLCAIYVYIKHGDEIFPQFISRKE